MTTLRALLAAGLVVGTFGLAGAKLPPPPPPTDAQKAAAEEKKASIFSIITCALRIDLKRWVHEMGAIIV